MTEFNYVKFTARVRHPIGKREVFEMVADKGLRIWREDDTVYWRLNEDPLICSGAWANVVEARVEVKPALKPKAKS